MALPPAAGTPAGRARAVLATAALALALAGCSGELARIPARGEIGGTMIETSVDAPVARYYLEDYLAGHRTRPELDHALDRSFAELPEEPTRAAYQRLSERFSVDLATLHLIEVLAGGRPTSGRGRCSAASSRGCERWTRPAAKPA